MPIITGAFLIQALVAYATGKGIDHIILKKSPEFRCKLEILINKTIEEFGRTRSMKDIQGKFHFYKSQIIIEELLKYRFFKNNDYVLDSDRIIEELKQNPKILPPKQNDLEKFLLLFETRIKEDEELMQLAIEEGYKLEIFNISQNFYSLFEQINRIEDLIEATYENTDQIKKTLETSHIEYKPPKELTLVPQRSSSEIIGRSRTLADLRTTLLQKGTTVILNGMGGIGKTTLAEVYVNSWYSEYNHIAWIKADYNFEEAVKSNIVLLNNLQIEGVEVKHKFDVCMNQLSKLNGPNLLVIDNATQELGEYFGKLPKTPNWHILATSKELIEPFYNFDVNLLSEQESIEFFKHFCKNFSDTQIKAIVETVQYHTLTIEILAKASKKNRWSFEKCLSALKDDAKANVSVKRSENKKIAEIKSFITSIFNLSQLGENERWILKQFTALPTTEIEYDILHLILKVEKLDWTNDFPSVLAELKETGFIRESKDGNSYQLHAILKEVLITELKPTIEDVYELIDSISFLLTEDSKNKSNIKTSYFIPYGEEIITQFSVPYHTILSALKNNLSLAYSNIGKSSVAKTLLEKTLSEDIENLGLDHYFVGIRKSNLANFYLDLAQYNEALIFIQDALILRKKRFGNKHPEVIRDKSKMASVYSHLGKPKKARDLFIETLVSAIEIIGENSPEVAQIKSSTALNYINLDECDKAKDLLENALISDLKIFGKNHPTIATRKSNLALAYQCLGHNEKAKDLYEEALESDLKNYGEKNPKVANRKSNLAIVYAYLNKYKRAAELMHSALNIYDNIYGNKHPEVARCQSILAIHYSNLNKLSKAKSLAETAFNTAKEIYKKDHFNLAAAQSNMALVYYNVREDKKALQLWESAYNTYVNIYGKSHNNSKTVLNFIRMIKK